MEAELLSLATAHLEEDVVPWFQWLEHSIGHMTLAQFKRAVQTRFGSLEEADAGGSLSKLRQTWPVREYQLQFERLANKTIDLPESFLISCFIYGLHDDIKAGVQLLKSTSLLQAFEQARFQEEFISVTTRKGESRSTFNKSTLALPDLEDEVKDTSPIVEIFLKALILDLIGLSSQNTMRLKGSIREHGVTILVDSVGDGGVISSSGKCYNVHVNIQGFQFQLDFYLLPVSGCDIVLGVEWLQSLGAILWDFSKLTMQFSWNGQSVKLTGYRSLPAVLADRSEFNRLLLQEKQDFQLEEWRGEY
ncbi:hypothetical protein Dsin_025995 [Dipteronia sinensis]|uniref:Retrotransposon gag domain-containing protein n=1 Tax=Dipteronia sinensis TaxID=43782 RepID=A0AAE0DXC9_9ROSI|nr:hypothetical protein Dsin_025995 [Dipteronia sinensis]